MKITVAHSPDSDDAFMFYGLASGAVYVPGIEVEQVLTVIAGQRSSKSGAVAMPRPSQPGATPSMRPPAPAQPSQRQPSLREKSPSRASALARAAPGKW